MTQIVLTLLGVLGGGGLVALVAAFAARKKTDAETTDIVTKAAERILSRYEQDNSELRAELKALKVAGAAEAKACHLKNDALERDIARLRGQMRRLADALRKAGINPDLAIEGEL